MFRPDVMFGPQRRRRLTLLLVLATGLWCLWWLTLKLAPPPDPYQILPPGVRVLDRHGTWLRGFLSPDEKRRWQLDLDEISPQLITAVLQHEDRWFYRHPGINLLAVQRAAWRNLRAGRVTSGASTITMQLARLTHPRARTLGAKIQETFRALQYEALYSKNEILIRYLNLAPYGGNTEGVGAAAQIYFGKSARELSWAEACLLAILPQSPNRHNPLQHPDVALGARNRLARHLLANGVIDDQILAEILSSPLPTRLQRLPFKAPHFTRWTKKRHPNQTTLVTTLDGDLQSQAQGIVTDTVHRLRPLGISQAAAIILDASAGEIMTMVGSAGFQEDDWHGQVNGAIGRRSPGSTLKPLVYALAFDRGLATPQTLIEDVPRWFADYHPHNYDGSFSGAVKAGFALRHSLNVPAVALAAELEQSPDGGLYNFLKNAGVNSLTQNRDHYGLSLVLGGGEITLLELASLYGILGRQGVWIPTRDLLPPQKKAPATMTLLGKGSVWLTLQELSNVARPEPEILWQNTSHHQTIPWKTGTSYGHRDAWSVGLAGPWVIAVWLGNFNGEGSPHLTGSEVAAPLFFALIDGLGLGGQAPWQNRPADVGSRDVCSVSGLPRSEACPAHTESDYLPGISPAEICDIHRMVEVDRVTGFSVCSRCRGDHPVDRKAVEWWPPLVSSYLATGGLAIPAIPPHNPQCPAMASSEAPVITSPQTNSEYFIRQGVPLADQALALQASVSAACHQVWWFADGALLKAAQPGETVFWPPTAGLHLCSVVDDAGRSASITIRISANP